MTDLIHTVPSFDTKPYTHLLHSLEKNLITTVDLITLDALEVAKRAQLPVLDVRRLANAVLRALQRDLGVEKEDGGPGSSTEAGLGTEGGSLKSTGQQVVQKWSAVSTLDPSVDAVLGGGFPTGYVTEITGESGVGKTQLVLQLLLAAQLPAPQGLSKRSIYITTEHPLPTTRLAQLLKSNPVLTSLPSSAPAPTLNSVLSIALPDLESQDHILRYQLPVAIQRQSIGLIVIDSIAANFRAEFERTGGPAALARRSAELIKLGGLLRHIARTYDVAIVVTNQVADRFAPKPPGETLFHSSPAPPGSSLPSASFPAPPRSTPTLNPLSLDHQMRWYTGWGADGLTTRNLKTPSLGHTWALQISARIALLKDPVYGPYVPKPDDEETPGDHERELLRWQRTLKVVFAPWVEGGGPGVEYEIEKSGITILGDHTADIVTDI
ncbi:MAG: hypothetical protein M1833_006578 [Piccolia ochrophora]|nr:MAG: hypothetical protein M1833_006578 [Piccolia ochrophora]